MDNAACKGIAPTNELDFDPFFPRRGESTDYAKRIICAGCRVVVECKGYAERTDSVGVWGAELINHRGDQ